MFPRLQHLTYDPWIQLKVTSLSSTASIFKYWFALWHFALDDPVESLLTERRGAVHTYSVTHETITRFIYDLSLLVFLTPTSPKLRSFAIQQQEMQLTNVYPLRTGSERVVLVTQAKLIEIFQTIPTSQ